MLRRRLLGQSGDRLDLPSSLHLAEMDKGDVWNLIVDTGNPSNSAERYHDIPNILRCSFICRTPIPGQAEIFRQANWIFLKPLVAWL